RKTRSRTWTASTRHQLLPPARVFPRKTPARSGRLDFERRGDTRWFHTPRELVTGWRFRRRFASRSPPRCNPTVVRSVPKASISKETRHEGTFGRCVTSRGRSRYRAGADPRRAGPSRGSRLRRRLPAHPSQGRCQPVRADGEPPPAPWQGGEANAA